MTIEELRVLITAKTDSLQEGIKKATSRLEGFRKTSDDMSSSNSKNIEKMKNQYDNLIKKLDIVNAQAEAQQRKLDSLKERFSGFGGVRLDSPEAAKLQEQILRAEARLHSLISTSDKTAGKISELEDKMNGVGAATEKANGKFKGLGDRLDHVRDKFRDTGRNAEESTGKIAGFATMLDRSFRRVLRRIFVYSVMYKAVRGFIGYIGEALKTNDSFMSSLNTIKTNLMVAFQPIYDFVLPAIQALMNGLATLTSYIASFTSALFGKTYKQSYDAAKGIETAKKQMDGYGGAAKKAGKEAQGALMGFDEINQLDIQEPDSGGEAGGFEMEMPDLTEIDEGPIERLKNSLADMFKLFKDAWDNEGQNTINSAKRALESTKVLINEVGKSFKEVWAGGTGQAILETMLRILQNIFNTIGDIAQSFTKAWTEAGLGISIMQHMHNIILHILTLAERLTGAFREVLGEVGDKLARILLETLNNILATLDHLGEKLVWVWDNGGEHLFQGFVRLGAKIAELAMFILNEFVLPFVNWFADLMAPVVAVVMDAIGWLFDRFSDLIDWLMDDGYPVLETIVTVLGSMAIAFGVVESAILAYNIVMGIATTVSSVFGAVMAFITSPIGLVTIAIGAVIAIGVLFYKHWDEISVWIKDLWQGIKTNAEEIWGAIKEFFIKTWNDIKTSAQTTWEGIKNFILTPIQNADTQLTRIWSNLKSFILGKWGEIRQGIASKGNSLIDAIKSPFVIAKKWIDDLIKDAFNWGKNLMNNIVDGIKSKMNAVKNAVSNVASTIGGYIGFSSPTKEGPGKDADKWMPNLMNMLAEGIESNIYKLEGSVNVAAQTLQGVENPSNSMASAVGNAVLAAMQVSNAQNTGISEEREIVVAVDGTKLARILIPKMDSEAQRMGFKTILQTP